MKDLQYYADHKVEIIVELYMYTKTSEREKTDKYNKIIDGLKMILQGMDTIIEDMEACDIDG